MPEKKDDFALLNYLDQLVEELRVLAGRAVNGAAGGPVVGPDVEAVHDARVATRRLKAAMDLLEKVVSRKSRQPVAKITRLLRRRLSALRDVDVMLEHLAEIKSPRHAPAVAWMKGRLEESRHKAAEQAAADLPPAKILARLGAWWGLREEIATAKEAVDSLLAESVHLQLDGFAEQATQLVQQPQGADPHELRVAGKSLRYTLEMAKAHGVRLPRSVIGSFKRIQTALGYWHDYVVLTERMLSESVDEQLAHNDPATQQALLSLASGTLRRSQLYLAKVTQLWQADGAGLAEQIRGSFPLTTVVAQVPALPVQEEKIGHEGQIAPSSP